MTTYFAIIENGDGKLSIEEVIDHGKSKGQPPMPPAFIAMLKKHAGTDGKLDKAEFIKLLKQMHGPPPTAPTSAIYKSQKQRLRGNAKK